MSERAFVPIRTALVPVVHGQDARHTLRAAQAVASKVVAVGIVPVSDAAELSGAAYAARSLRAKLRELARAEGVSFRARVRVSDSPWSELVAASQAVRADLLLMSWEGDLAALGVTAAQVLADPPCDLALVHGRFPDRCRRVLVPVRGGPYAELALRIAMGLRPECLRVLHILPDHQAADAPFRGLEPVLANLPAIEFEQIVSPDAAAAITARAGDNDLLVMGATSDRAAVAPPLGPVVSRVLEVTATPAIVVRSRGLAGSWVPAETAGLRAISVLVDKWFAENTFDASEFGDLDQLVARKEEQGITVSLALPALNEAATIGQVLQTVQNVLVKEFPLLDEIIVMDSDSTDDTRRIAEGMGVPVYIHQQLLPELGLREGKGEALWKSLLVTSGDIVAWIDTDIVNIHPRFVYGIIGPLLVSPHIQLVKGFYRRPLRVGDTVQAGSGGRVTELMARPMLNLFYPELSGIVQPLSGEYAGRRRLLERLPFFSGYGVETGLLIDALEAVGLPGIAQVNLLERVHHNQPLEALGKMSFEIAQVIVRRLEKRYGISLMADVNKSMKVVRYSGGRYWLAVREVVAVERPPMIELAEYRDRHRDGA